MFQDIKRRRSSPAQSGADAVPPYQQQVQAAGNITGCSISFGDPLEAGESTASAGAGPSQQLPQQPHLQQMQIGSNLGQGANFTQM